MLKKLAFIICLIGVLHNSWSQQIEIQGNGIMIALDGSNTADKEDGTQYESTPIDASRIHDFVLLNTGQENIQILSIRSSSAEFRIDSRIRRIRRGQSVTLELAFEPTSTGAFQGVVIILAREGRTFRVYRFNVSGDAREVSGDAELMISQYYENGNNDQIEVKNLTDYNIRRNDYVLAMFDNSDDLDRAPAAGNTIRIGDLDPGEVVVYDNLSFNGDEVFVISSSRGRNCYADRIDLIGNQNNNWGNSKSLSKGGCASETAHRDFDLSQWVELSLSEVNGSLEQQNLFLGTHQSGEIIWDGTNWTSNALPDRTRTVRIDGLYSSQNLRNIEACDLIVDNELDFDSNGKKSVVVYRNLSVSENGNFHLGDQESLVMYDDAAVITGAIKKVEKSTPLNNSYDFTYWSSPISSASIADVFSGVRSGRTYYFDQSKTTASSPDSDPDGTYWHVWVPADGTMKPGRGYASEAKADVTNIHQISFEGTPNNGVVYEQIHFNDDEDDGNDYNLIGNPYPSAINIDLFFDKNEEFIDPAIYLWTHTTPVSEQSGDYSFNDYATYNRTGGTAVGNGPVPDKNIGSGQGFLVRAIAGVDIEFNNSMRIVDSNDQFFKSSVVKKKDKENEKDRIWLNLSTDQGGFNQLLIGFVKGASFGFDRGYDALKNQGSNKISFYSLLDDKKLAIQGLGLLESRAEVPLGFDTNVSNRTYTIAVSAVEGKLRDAEIMLHDHYLNMSHDLRNSNYVFEQVDQGSFQDRFSLAFTKEVELESDTVIEKDQFVVYNDGDTFRIQASESVETVRMYDILGNMILENHPRNTSFEIVEPSSKRGDVLLLQIIQADQRQKIKKVYKQ